MWLNKPVDPFVDFLLIKRTDEPHETITENDISCFLRLRPEDYLEIVFRFFFWGKAWGKAQFAAPLVRRTALPSPVTSLVPKVNRLLTIVSH